MPGTTGDTRDTAAVMAENTRKLAERGDKLKGLAGQTEQIAYNIIRKRDGQEAADQWRAQQQKIVAQQEVANAQRRAQREAERAETQRQIAALKNQPSDRKSVPQLPAEFLTGSLAESTKVSGSETSTSEDGREYSPSPSPRNRGLQRGDDSSDSSGSEVDSDTEHFQVVRQPESPKPSLAAKSSASASSVPSAPPARPHKSRFSILTGIMVTAFSSLFGGAVGAAVSAALFGFAVLTPLGWIHAIPVGAGMVVGGVVGASLYGAYRLGAYLMHRCCSPEVPPSPRDKDSAEQAAPTKANSYSQMAKATGDAGRKPLLADVSNGDGSFTVDSDASDSETDDWGDESGYLRIPRQDGMVVHEPQVTAQQIDDLESAVTYLADFLEEKMTLADVREALNREALTIFHTKLVQDVLNHKMEAFKGTGLYASRIQMVENDPVLREIKEDLEAQQYQADVEAQQKARRFGRQA